MFYLQLYYVQALTVRGKYNARPTLLRLSDAVLILLLGFYISSTEFSLYQYE